MNKSSQKKVKENKERHSCLMWPIMCLFINVCVIVMLTYDHSCSYCVSKACQDCMIKRNPLRLTNDFKLIKIESYTYSPFYKKPEVAGDDNNDT